MQYVRCDACGAKALFAASRCPKCTHAFYLRDHRGQMVPLSHCRKCDTYYPRTVGGCKWCGTKSPPATVTGYRVIAGVAVVLVLAALGAYTWATRRATAPPVAADSSVADTSSSALAATLPPPVDSERLTSDTMPGVPAESSEPAAAVPVTTAPVVATMPPPPGSELPVTMRWTRATALTYINVRSGADRKAPVVGVVTPSMHVELGAQLRGWRQVRAPGVSGWADPRNFSSESPSPVR